MKPKMYRKTKPNKGSNMTKYVNNAAGGKFTSIVGPASSVGDTGSHTEHPSVETGEKKLERI